MTNNPKPTSTGMPELKPCPFCPDGGKPYRSDATNETSEDGGRMVYVGCAICGVNLKAANYPQMDGSWKMSKDIVSIWNTRADLPAASVQAGGVREAVEYIKRVRVWNVADQKSQIDRHIETLIAAAERQVPQEVVDVVDLIGKLTDREDPITIYGEKVKLRVIWDYFKQLTAKEK